MRVRYWDNWGSHGERRQADPPYELTCKAIYASFVKDSVSDFTRKVIYAIMTESYKKESPLEVIRLKAGVTQEAVSTALGITDHTYRNWVKGRAEARLTIRQIKRLCEILACELKDLPDDFYER